MIFISLIAIILAKNRRKQSVNATLNDLNASEIIPVTLSDIKTANVRYNASIQYAKKQAQNFTKSTSQYLLNDSKHSGTSIVYSPSISSLWVLKIINLI